MRRLLFFLIWSAVFCVALLVIDQFLVRVPLQQPALVATQRFYLDFRQRLLTLGKQEVAPTIEGLIEREQLRAPAPTAKDSPAAAPAPVTKTPQREAATPSTPTSPAPAAKPAGYVYADANGTLQIVERLEQIPPRFRSSAQPLAK